MTKPQIVIGSFYTPDEDYGNDAKQLRQQLDELGLEHELLEVQKNDGEDWADVTRKRLALLKKSATATLTKWCFGSM